MEFMPFIMFIAVCGVLMLGYPVAFTLSGVALMFALLGTVTGQFDGAFLEALPNRLFGIMSNQLLIAVFIYFYLWRFFVFQKCDEIYQWYKSESLL